MKNYWDQTGTEQWMVFLCEISFVCERGRRSWLLDSFALAGSLVFVRKVNTIRSIIKSKHEFRVPQVVREFVLFLCLKTKIRLNETVGRKIRRIYYVFVAKTFSGKQ